MEPENDRTSTHSILSKGTMVSHYRIVEKIGAGGMGEVFLAEDTQLDRSVALKFLPLHLCQDEDCRARFKREAQAAAKLDHPNIVTVHEVGEHQGRPYFAMQHLEGRSLREVIRGEKLDLDRIVGIAIQLCDGLSKAHRAGTIHRDIKPSNIIIDSNGRPRLLDFGLATIKGGEHLTKTGSTLGTVGYMSPEQIEGRETDARSDLFSLGVVLYELVAGKAPFKRDDEAATLKAIIADTPEPLARFKANMPDDLQRIVAKLLDKNPDLRYQSAADVISDLKRLGARDRIEVSKPSRTNALGRYLIVLVSAVALFVLVKLFWPKSEETAAGRKMLAVLPFENLGDPEDEYFADGMTEEITTSLARLSGLGVISRTSAIQYKKTEKSLKEIGKELNVDYVLEGTIRWDKSAGESRVRINPQLIRVSDDMHMWADRYDAVLTDVFDVQSTIAQEVAAALNVTLLHSEQEALSGRANVNPEAYDYYLRGKQNFSTSGYRQEGIRIAETMYLKAIELAPDFAPAYAELGALYTELYWNRMDTAHAILDSAKRLIDVAMSLAPESPEVCQSQGWYYYHGLRDFDRAVEWFSRVLELQPNNSQTVASIAWVERRQGKWEEATAGLRRAVELDPRDPWYHYELGNTYVYTGHYALAQAQYDQSIDLEPVNEWAFARKSWVTLLQTGDPDSALSVIDEGRRYHPRSPHFNFISAYYHLCAGRYDLALSMVTGPRDFYLEDYSEGFDYYFIKGWIYVLMEKRDLARPYLDSARIVGEWRVSKAPSVASYHSELGIVYALLGQKDAAIAAARRGVELQPVSADALEGPERIRDLASVYANVGEYDLALSELDASLRIPSSSPVNWLRIAPQFLSLRDDPRFQALLEKYRTEHGT